MSTKKDLQKFDPKDREQLEAWFDENPEKNLEVILKSERFKDIDFEPFLKQDQSGILAKKKNQFLDKVHQVYVKGQKKVESLVVNVPIKEIKESNGSCSRHVSNEENLEALAESIADIGMLQPIILDSEYHIFAGRRRLAAAHMAGLKTVPAVIREVKDSREAFLIEISENIFREDLTSVDRLLAIGRAKKMGFKNVEIARHFNMYETQISPAVQAVETIPEDLLNRINDQIVSGEKSYSFSTLMAMRTMDPDSLSAIIDEEKTTMRDVKSSVKDKLEDDDPSENTGRQDVSDEDGGSIDYTKYYVEELSTMVDSMKELLDTKPDDFDMPDELREKLEGLEKAIKIFVG
jgi:ParB family chromosome partitioning protein